MKKIKNLRQAFITLLTATAMFTACQKSDDTEVAAKLEMEQATISSEADAEANVFYDDVFDIVMGTNSEVGLGGSIGIHGRSSTKTAARFKGIDSASRCFSTTITPLAAGAFKKTVTVNFGTGCKGRDGHMRRGKVITVFTGRMIKPGNKATTTFDGYYVDSVKVEGTHTIQNNSTSNNRIFTVRVENGKLTKPSGNYVAWNDTKTRTQTEGNGTPEYIKDDVYSIRGEASGTVKHYDKTIQWSSAIVEPIIRKFTCRWAVKGQIKITRNTKTSLLDYGNGSCDDQATLTINGQVHNITLR